MASAFLEGKGLAFSKHSAVIAAFGKYFIKTSDFPKDYHRNLINAEKTRCSADYSTIFTVTREEAQQYISQAEDFFNYTVTKIL
ncbi:MAG: HEPN domain-containing protein [Microcystaceae cyanobacterium]